MNKTAILVEIKKRLNSMTSGERKVAEYVLAHPVETMDLTITDLSRTCQVGETTVFRFCKSLELAGYQDFRIALALSTEKESMLDIQTHPVDPMASADLISLADQVSDVFLSSVKDTRDKLNPESLEKAVDLMLNARTVHIYGFGNSGVSAEMLQNRLMRIMGNVFHVKDVHMQLTSVALLTPEDVAVIFTNSGMTKDCKRLAEMAKSRHCPVVLISRTKDSPTAEFADIVLTAGAIEGPMEGGSISSVASQMFMVTLIYAELFRRKGEEGKANKILTSSAIAERKF